MAAIGQQVSYYSGAQATPLNGTVCRIWRDENQNPTNDYNVLVFNFDGQGNNTVYQHLKEETEPVDVPHFRAI